MRRPKIAALLFFAVIFGLASGGFATPPKMPYTIPSGGLYSGEFEVVSWNADRGGVLKCFLGSGVGTPSHLDIKFDSSMDLKVEPASVQIPSLRQGERKEFRIQAVKISTEKKDVMGTWVRVTVTYSPDYAALRQWVQAEPRKFTIQDGYLKNVLDSLKEREAQGKREIFSRRGFLNAMQLFKSPKDKK